MSDASTGLTAATIVRAVHLAAFGAEANPDQIAAMAAGIAEYPDALIALARQLYEYRRAIDRATDCTIRDHSQNGEFGMMLRQLLGTRRGRGIIVDVGANGRSGSNSYDLLTEYGWEGLLIEANPHLLPRIRAEFGSARYRLVDCAIATEPGRGVLHLGGHDHLSSLDPTHLDLWGKSAGTAEVEIRRLGDVLDEHGIPADFDILSLDIEGLDVDVLNQLIATTSYRPGWIIIELPLPLEANTLRDSGLSAMVQNFYELVDRTMPNLILRLKDVPVPPMAQR